VPTAADAARLTYTTMVIKEAMRLYPPVYAIARRTAAADTIGGYHLPAGSLVLVSTWVVHGHPRHWDQPASFDPDRFAPENDNARHRYAYLPFAAGPRACIGAHFAMLEAVIAHRHDRPRPPPADLPRRGPTGHRAHPAPRRRGPVHPPAPSRLKERQARMTELLPTVLIPGARLVVWTTAVTYPPCSDPSAHPGDLRLAACRPAGRRSSLQHRSP
jgi:Cytochrome P450